MSQRLQYTFAIAFAALLLAASAFGQSTFGSFTGTAKDPTGAVIPGTALEIVNTATNVRTEARSDANGSFFAPSLPPVNLPGS